MKFKFEYNIEQCENQDVNTVSSKYETSNQTITTINISWLIQFMVDNTTRLFQTTKLILSNARFGGRA